jgi:16S rRNA processing protein RimM
MTIAEQTSNSASSGAPDYLIVGQIVAPFGVRGEMKANILTDFPERLGKLEEVVLAPFDSIEPGLAPTAALNPGTVHSRWAGRAGQGSRPPSKPTPFKIESTHIHKGQLLLKLDGVTSADTAEQLRGYWLLVPRENAKKLPRGAYYIYQIVGLDVVAQGGRYIGKVEDVITTSANDVYVVKGPGVEDPTGELLVPAIKPVVKRMEMKRGRIVIADPSEWA